MVLLQISTFEGVLIPFDFVVHWKIWFDTINIVN